MKARIAWLVLVFIAFMTGLSGLAFTQTDVSGLWQGTLAASPDAQLTLRFNISRNADGSYKADLDAAGPTEVRRVPVSKVTFGANRLVFAVDEFSGSYEGTYDGKASINGQWKQEGASIPLVFARYDQASAPSLAGDWQGEIASPAGNFPIAFRFEESTDGKKVGYIVDAKRGTRARMADVEYVGGALKFRQPTMQLKYEGTVAGATMKGTWTQTAMGQTSSAPIVMSRKSFEVPVTPLALSDTDMEKVRGAWVAESGDTKGVTLQFETLADGKHVGYFDLPAFSLAGLPVSEATFADDQLFIRVEMLQSEYRARLSPGQLNGDWKSVAGGAMPLVLTHQ